MWSHVPGDSVNCEPKKESDPLREGQPEGVL